MKITKLGHCCLVIETKGKRIMTDPGSYTIDAQEKERNIDYILFTHEHQDHYHLESLKRILAANPKAQVYANDSVSALLAEASIAHTKVSHGEELDLGGISLLGIGEKHALIHKSIPLSSNLGFFVDGSLWYPGDAFTDPERAVDILALPSAGPWLKVSEPIDYAIALRPRVVFPVHDAGASAFMQTMIGRILGQNGVRFEPMREGDSKEF